MFFFVRRTTPFQYRYVAWGPPHYMLFFRIFTVTYVTTQSTNKFIVRNIRSKLAVAENYFTFVNMPKQFPGKQLPVLV